MHTGSIAIPIDLLSFPHDIAEKIIWLLPAKLLHNLMKEFNSSQSRFHPLFDLIVRGICRSRFRLNDSVTNVEDILELATLHPASVCPIALDFTFDAYNEYETALFVLLLQQPNLHTIRDVHVTVEKDEIFSDGLVRFCQATEMLVTSLSLLSLDLSSAHESIANHIFRSVPTFINLKNLLFTYNEPCQKRHLLNVPESVEILSVNSNVAHPGCWPKGLKSLSYHQSMQFLDLSGFAGLEYLELFQNSPDFSFVLPATIRTLSLVRPTIETLENMDFSCLPFLESLALALLPHLHNISRLKFPDSLQRLLVEDCPIGHSSANFSSMVGLSHLSLENTHLCPKILESIDFPQLKLLILADSQLRSFPNLCHLSSLEELCIRDSTFTECSQLPVTIMKLELSSREKFTLPVNLPLLHSLSLRNVKLTSTEFPLSLEELTLSYSDVSNVQFPESLESLTITRSPWVREKLELPSSLCELNLRGNSLTTLSHIRIPGNIVELDTSDNILEVFG